MNFGSGVDAPKSKNNKPDVPVVERRGFVRAGLVCLALSVISMFVVLFSYSLGDTLAAYAYYYGYLLFQASFVLFIAFIVLLWLSRVCTARIAVSIIGLVLGGFGLIASIVLLVLLCDSMKVSGMNAVSGLVWIFYFPALVMLIFICCGILVVSILALRSSLKFKRRQLSFEESAV